MLDFVAIVLFIPAATWLVNIVAQGLIMALVKVDTRWVTITTVASFVLYFSTLQLRGYATMAAVSTLVASGASLFNGIVIESDYDRRYIAEPPRLIKRVALIVLGGICWCLALILVNDG